MRRRFNARARVFGRSGRERPRARSRGRRCLGHRQHGSPGDTPLTLSRFSYRIVVVIGPVDSSIEPIKQFRSVGYRFVTCALRMVDGVGPLWITPGERNTPGLSTGSAGPVEQGADTARPGCDAAQAGGACRTCRASARSSDHWPAACRLTADVRIGKRTACVPRVTHGAQPGADGPSVSLQSCEAAASMTRPRASRPAPLLAITASPYCRASR